MFQHSDDYDYEDFIGFDGLNSGESFDEFDVGYFFEPTFDSLNGIMAPMNPQGNLRYTSPIAPSGYYDATVSMSDYAPTQRVMGGQSNLGSVQDAISLLQLSDFVFRA